MGVRQRRQLRLGRQVESYIQADRRVYERQRQQGMDDRDRDILQRNRQRVRSDDTKQKLREKWGATGDV